MLRNRTIKKKYGLTESQFYEWLVEQSYCCALCRTRLTRATTHVDHDHGTGRVRGLLCFNCNVAIGHFRDDPGLMRSAASYVERARRDHDDEVWRAAIRAEVASYGLGEMGD